jgi:hypothetical protein
MGTPETYAEVRRSVSREANKRARPLLRLISDKCLRGVNLIAVHVTDEGTTVRLHRRWSSGSLNENRLFDQRGDDYQEQWREASIHRGYRSTSEWREFRMPSVIYRHNPYPWFIVVGIARRRRIPIVLTEDGLPKPDLPRRMTGYDLAAQLDCTPYLV